MEFEPCRRAVMTDRSRANNLSTRGLELAHAGRVKWMNRRDGLAIERAVKLAPFARRRHGPGGETDQIQHAPDLHGIDGEHLAEQRYRGLAVARGSRRLNRPLLRLETRKAQHRSSQDILGFRVRRHAEARNIYADDAHAINLLGQEPQGNPGSCRHAEIDDDDGVVFFGIGKLEDGLANVFEKLARHQCFRIERHISDRAAGAVKMRGESQSIDAAGRAGENCRRATHAKANAQGAESRTHALRLIVRTRWIVPRVLP